MRWNLEFVDLKRNEEAVLRIGSLGEGLFLALTCGIRNVGFSA